MTNIYIYIYIERERERERVCVSEIKHIRVVFNKVNYNINGIYDMLKTRFKTICCIMFRVLAIIANRKFANHTTKVCKRVVILLTHPC
jgi:hypothetical protein